MRLVIDIQGYQSLGSRVRGIGRYTLSLAQAMARQAGRHEVIVALNDAIPDAIEPVRSAFDGLVAAENIVTWGSLPGTAEIAPGSAWNARAAEHVYEGAMARLKPDFVHVTSLFEGISDEVTTSIGLSQSAHGAATTLYDLIPFVQQKKYLADPRVSEWYFRKIEHLRRADLHLAISDFTRHEAVELLGLVPDNVVNISGSCSDHFHPIRLRPEKLLGLLRRHGITRPYVMYAGGFDPRKNLASLIRAYAALPHALREAHQLVIVGSGPAPEYQELLDVRARSGLGDDECLFVGYTPDDELAALYSHCRLYVFPSLHEGFGLPALEAMACGAVVIGSNLTSLPEVIGFDDATFDPHREESITRRMAMALVDESFRQAFLAHAVRQVAKFSWDECARRAWAGLERVHDRREQAGRLLLATAGDGAPTDGEEGDASVSPHAPTPAQAADDADGSATVETIARGIAVLADGPDPADPRWRKLASAIAWNQALAEPPQRRLMVDVSELVIRDMQSGIQRVVRNVLKELLGTPGWGYEVHPVYVDEHGTYRHAHALVARLSGHDATDTADDEVVEWNRHDTFLGLDMSVDVVTKHTPLFVWLRDHGVAMYFVVYDLIPLLRPDSVNQGILPLFRRWYETVASIADGVICISQAVATDFQNWLDQTKPTRHRPLAIGYFHLGADMDRDAEEAPQADGVSRTGERRVLAVGTIEPRKGYAQILDAFESLWARGEDITLTIVGKQGWHVDDLVQRLQHHGELGKRLFWREGIADDELEALYRSSDVLLFASEMEGFGLPLIEASRRGLPILARDLPVFREVAGEHAAYFSGWTANALSQAISDWFARRDKGEAVGSAGMKWLTWEQSTRQLIEAVEGRRWDVHYRPTHRYWFPVVDPRMQSQIGVRERDTVQTDGQSGILIYGPYARVAAGNYVLRAYGRSDHAPDGSWLDVVYDTGARTLGKFAIGGAGDAGDGILLEAAFTLDHDVLDMEVRLWAGGGQWISLSAIELTRWEDTPLADRAQPVVKLPA